IHSRKIRFLREDESCADNLRKRTARSGKNGFHVAQALPGLFLDGFAGYVTSERIEGTLTGHKYQPGRLDGLAVTRCLGRLIGSNDFSRHVCLLQVFLQWPGSISAAQPTILNQLV